MPAEIADSPLLTPDEAAAFLRSNSRTMERWRVIGDGPAFVKIGRRVAYRLDDLETWIQQRRHTHTT